MFETIMYVFLALNSFAIFLCLVRAILGPTMQDRVVALDTVGLLLIAFTCLIMIIHDTIAYTKIVIVMGLLVFIGSIAIARYLERGDVIDRN